MGRREKKVKAEEYISSEEVKKTKKARFEAANSDDDAEANEDLSLKIVQKSIQRSFSNDPRENGVSEIITNLKEEKSRKEKKKRKKSKEIEAPTDVVDNVKDNEKIEIDKAAEVSSKAAEISSGAVETNPVEVPDNVVLRKLLRGPRYFDPPDNNWGACYNCGEEGHKTVNCTAARRKKPCFVCGSFEHNAKQCSKGRDCFICKQHGHRAKDCPERTNSSKLCLKCGDLGHDMFSCRNDYCSDDMKEIQCYICGRFGHLCCKNYSDPGPRELSCYRCGLSGHTGLACMASYGGDTNDNVSASSCYRCGLVGHFARECTSSMKDSKRNREPSTPKQRSSKKNKDRIGAKSAPNEFGKIRKKKKHQSSEYSPASKTKHRGGWTADDRRDYYSHSSQSNHQRTPSKPSNRRSKIPSPNDDYTSSPRSSKRPRNINFDNSPSNGSARFYQHRYSASRFGDYSNGGMGRNNMW